MLGRIFYLYCKMYKKRACSALRGTSIVGHLIGWGRAPEYWLPVCVCVFLHMATCLFVKACILLRTSLHACIFAEAARHIHIRRFSTLQCTYAGLSALSVNQDEAQHLNCALRGKNREEWEKRIEWVWLREMDECSDKRSCLGPDRYARQMDDSYLGDHRVHTHA